MASCKVPTRISFFAPSMFSSSNTIAALGPAVSAPHASGGILPVISIDPLVEHGLVESLRHGDAAIAMARRLAAEEGVFTGISAGATMAAAVEVARDAKPGAVILAMLPDTGERYFSTPLFEGVADGSDDDWLAGLP